MARRGLKNAFGDSSPETNPKPSTEVAVVTGAEVTESRSARLAALTRTITSAWTTYGSTVRASQEQFARQAGPCIEEVHRDELWREEGWASFNAWFKHVVGFESSHVYEILDGVKVSRVIGQPVNIGQGRALAPVLRNHGEDAVRRQWSAAEAAGRPTAKMLKAKAIDLGFVTPPKPRKPSAIAEAVPAQTVSTSVDETDIVDAEIVDDPAPPGLTYPEVLSQMRRIIQHLERKDPAGPEEADDLHEVMMYGLRIGRAARTRRDTIDTPTA